ncbi:MAG: RNA methyltransferase [Candidatus Cloacimonetes bacterium]|nr:RNA methyltransferase [Candidatus Cloacimonadota bacterium]
MTELISLSSNHFHQLLKLKQKKFRELFGKTLIEGMRTIGQMAANGIIFDELICESGCSVNFKGLPAKAIFSAPAEAIRKLGSVVNPQEIIAVARTCAPAISRTSFLLYLDNIQDPGNLGTIYRSAAAAGIDGIMLSPDCCEIFNPKVIRSSLGLVFTIPSQIVNSASLEGREAIKIASVVEDGINIFRFQRPVGDIILILGSEAHGVTSTLLELAEYKVSIPVSTNIESLNVSVATGILVYQLIYGCKRDL